MRVDETSEQLKYQSGKHFWNWVTNSNPIARAVLGQLNLNEDQIAVISGQRMT